MNAIDIEQLKIVLHPDPVLRYIAEGVDEVTPEICRLAEKMLELMHDAPGVGLAAPQVGVSLRLFVVNATGEVEDDRVFINPKLMDATEEMDAYEEGCLSLPGVTCTIKRPRGITIEAMGLDGELFRLRSEEMPAKIWQHENDHLDGKLIIDKMSLADRVANRKAIKALLG